ncbi:FG-GAP-like repeat-containing protein [Planctobacterium marinum]|uniref:FG-GAP-like repeat-containing protein n=1 Tax=Planctobacterium marinum TaxID=1631968 RepID=UPI001E430D45|nr:FG-GAP-like repeat-containing protein [Planctobacterium marinum]MCC2608077.1 FG-GAP-like repeat-containing protein [Planctobacterium marinum]
MKLRHRFIRVIFISSMLVFTGIAAAQTSPALWQLTQNIGPEALKNRAQHNNSAEVTLNNTLVLQLKADMLLRLPVFSESVEVKLSQSRQQGSTIVWEADNIHAPHLPKAQLFLNNGRLSAWIPTMAGTFRLHNGKLIKEFKMGGDIPDYRLPQNIKKLNKDGEVSSENHQKRAPTHSENRHGGNQSAAGDLTFNVLFVVTNEFVNSYPDTEAQINEYISANNAIYEASGINIQMASAGIMQSDLEQYSADQLLDNLSSNGGSDSTDGEIPDSLISPIWQARVNNSADFIVVMLNDLPEGLCGQGWLNGNSSQVFDYDYAVNVTAAFTTFSGNPQFCGYDTLGHELGHNMGLAHSLRQGDDGKVFTYGRGYGVVDEFTTIMAYASEFGSASEVAVFSSPDLTCLNRYQCGVEHTQSDGADAVFAVNQVKEEVTLIHNDEVTLPIADALATLDDSQLADCISDNFPDAITNAQVGFLVCTTDYAIQTINGLENFPNLNTFSMDGSNDTSLAVFRNMRAMVQLDVRDLFMNSMRPIAHLQDQLTFLQFNQGSMSCQDVNAVESWGIDSFFPYGRCQSLSDDSGDFDSDGINNLDDTDDDNDGIDDVSDASPRDASNANDIDDDGVPDSSDAFPYNENESLDTDSDTVGNNQDSDDDNDGVPDAEDCAPLDNTQSSNCGSGQNNPPTISGTPDSSAQQNSLYSFTPSASDADDDSLTFSIENRPGWASFSSETGTLSGTPDNDDVGTYSNIMISVSDGTESAALSAFSITVVDVNDAPEISGSPDTLVRANNSYQFTPQASDPDGDSLTFSIANKPLWASFNTSTGTLSGIPDNSDTGIYSGIVISVSDGALSDSLPSFSITVLASISDGANFVAYDYDGDGMADVGVRRASNFMQYILNSSDDTIQRIQFGKDTGDISVSGDFDGDQIADVAVRRASNQFWYILNSSDGEIQRFNFGKQAEDIPVPADFDGDGITDIAVRRPSNQYWYILNSSDGEIQRYHFGKQAEDIPVPADYDGDGLADVAVRRPSNQFWYILNSSDGEIQRYNFGKQAEDIPVPADYDGDGKADIAVRRPSTQYWYILNSSDGQIQRIRFGLQSEDIPIPADYDGDGKVDVAVRRPSTQFQYILRSSDGEIERIQFGRDSADMPLAGPVMTRTAVQIPDSSGAAAVQEEPSIQRSIITAEQARTERVQ